MVAAQSVHNSVCLSTSNPVPKAWTISRELLVSSPCWTTEDARFLCHQKKKKNGSSGGNNRADALTCKEAGRQQQVKPSLHLGYCYQKVFFTLVGVFLPHVFLPGRALKDLPRVV